MGRKRKHENPIVKYRDKIIKEELQMDILIFLSILVSTGCRPSEAQQYKYIKNEKGIVTLELPVMKKRKEMTRRIQIKPADWKLKSIDYKRYQNNIRSLKALSRWTLDVMGCNARDYRHELSIFVLRKKNIVYVKEMLCHTDIRTTQIYLDGEKADFLEISEL